MASTSKIVEVEETPNLLERFTSLEVSDKEAKAKRQREKHHRLALEKRFQKSLSKGKGKAKESVHPEPSSPIAPDIGNVRVFEETPMEENSTGAPTVLETTIAMSTMKSLSLLDSIQACIIPVIYTMMEMDMMRPVMITTNQTGK